MRVGRDRGAASLLPPGGIRSGTGNGLCACQGKIESSAFQQSRKFRFLASPRGGRGNLASSAEGSRPRRRGKAEATESAPKAIGTSPPRSVGNRAEGFPVQDASRRGEGLRSEAEALHFKKERAIAFGEIPERRLCILKTRRCRAAFARLSLWTVATVIVARLSSSTSLHGLP